MGVADIGDCESSCLNIFFRDRQNPKDHVAGSSQGPTGVPRSSDQAPPTRAAIGPQAYSYCRDQWGVGLSWARYPCTHSIFTLSWATIWRGQPCNVARTTLSRPPPILESPHEKSSGKTSTSTSSGQDGFQKRFVVHRLAIHVFDDRGYPLALYFTVT